MWQSMTQKLTDTCINAFSEEVEIHYLQENGSYRVLKSKAVYDASYQQIDIQSGAVISSNAPMIEISSRFIDEKITNRDKVKARGVTYRIKEIQPDDSGALKILLAR